MQWTWRFGALADERHARLLGLKRLDQWTAVAQNDADPAVPSTPQWRWTLTLPDLPANHVLIPSFAMLTDAAYGFRFALTYTSAGESGSAALSHIGECGLSAPALVQGEAVVAPIDCFVTRTPLHNLQITLQLDAPAPPIKDVLLCISCRPWEIAPATGTLTNAAPLHAPALSQMVLSERFRHSACSPVCIAMGMGALGRNVEPEAFATAVYHDGMFGVWPANLYAASRRGVLGSIETFTHIDDAVALLDAGLPVIASTRWKEGELRNGALARSGGHLILLRGFSADAALVNDPAAATAGEVTRGYQREEFGRIWLRERGAAYMLLPMLLTGSRALPDAK